MSFWNFDIKDINGLSFNPPLTPEHLAYLRRFSQTRRMRRDEEKATALPDPHRERVHLPVGSFGEFFVGGCGFAGQEKDMSVLDQNTPPYAQPDLWCSWCPNEKGTHLEWLGEFSTPKDEEDVEKWLNYLVQNFFKKWDYEISGAAKFFDESLQEWALIVVDNEQAVWHSEKTYHEYLEFYPEARCQSQDEDYRQLDWIQELNKRPNFRP